MIEPSYVRGIRAAYDTVADDYAERLSTELAARPLDRAMLAALAEFVKTVDGGPVADIGCGPGHVTAYLHSLGLSTVGIDLSPAMVAAARRAYPELRFDEDSMTDLSLSDGFLSGCLRPRGVTRQLSVIARPRQSTAEPRWTVRTGPAASRTRQGREGSTSVHIGRQTMTSESSPRRRVARLARKAHGIRRLASATSTLLLATCLTACSAAHQGPHVVAPGFMGAGVAYPDTHQATAYVFGDIIICLDKPGTVTIDSIELVNATDGIRIDDFGVIPNRMESNQSGYDDNSVPIAQTTPRPSHPVIMTTACPKTGNEPPRPDPQSVALLLQYSKTTDKSATSQGIKINYTTAGHKEWVKLGWTVALCAKETAASAANCPPYSM